MSQTTYLTALVVAFSGMLSDAGPNGVKSALNTSGVVLPFGIAVKSSTSGGTKQDGVTPPTAAGDKITGILVFSQATDAIAVFNSTVPGGSVADGRRCDLLEEGKCYVLVENAVTEGSQAYVRFANSANTTDGTQNQKGAFRADNDESAAEVWTGTPTAVDATVYTVRVETTDPITGKALVFVFEHTSQVSATATTIVTALKAEMAANAEFNALYHNSGTATLILTSQLAGQTAKVTTDSTGVIAWVNGTAEADSAYALKGCYFTRAAAAGGFAEVKFNSNASHV
jgi:hypothetical protein